MSDAFVQFLRQHGGTTLNIRYVSLVGLPEFCSEYYRNDNKDAQHVIVYADGLFVDWTLRQYIVDADFPTIYESVAPLLEHWRDVSLTTCLDWEFPIGQEA